jgi:hypothetical protein
VHSIHFHIYKHVGVKEKTKNGTNMYRRLATLIEPKYYDRTEPCTRQHLRDRKETCFQITFRYHWQKCGEERSRKILKYKDLLIEIQRLRNVKAKVIPIITGATGSLSRSIKSICMTSLTLRHRTKWGGHSGAREVLKFGLLLISSVRSTIHYEMNIRDMTWTRIKHRYYFKVEWE